MIPKLPRRTAGGRHRRPLERRRFTPTQYLRGALAFAVVLPTVALAVHLPSEAAETSDSKVVKSKTVQRSHLVDGANDVVDSRDVTVSFSQTKDLRSRQVIDVSWKGAHPTGAKISDVSSADAKDEEYPFVVLQCRGVDSTSVAVAKRVRPETCWTASAFERYAASTSPFPAWRSDRYAPAAEREAIVGRPKTLPDTCFPDDIEYWLPLLGANGAKYDGGPFGCGAQAPEAANLGGASLPSNTAYGITELDGSGEVSFDVWTEQDNATIGCSDKVACSLVVIPVMGISCDVDAAGLPAADRAESTDKAQAWKDCSATGKYEPGSIQTPNTVRPDIAVSGRLWWADELRNRISVPLTIAPAPDACDVASENGGIDVYGSELLSQATVQWAPHFCLDSNLFRFKHIAVGEPEARNLLSVGNVDGAFLSRPPDPDSTNRPIVNAPTAATAFSIGYTIDDEFGRPYRKLKLTPRLLAKLLSESYPGNRLIKADHPDIGDNPLDITHDPEFQALNPELPDSVSSSEAASTLLSLSSDSDVVEALTEYIDADPDARAWLNGKADPWGMKVNPVYEDIALPVESWPLLDTFESDAIAEDNICLRRSPVPYLPLIASPVSRLRLTTQALQFSIANSQTVCQLLAESEEAPVKLVPRGRQTPGSRFMIALTSTGAAERYAIDSAALLSQVGSGAATKFTSASGRTFVAPTKASMKAAVSVLEQDKSTGAWPIDYKKLRTSAPKAYPGTMLVYASVPTKGLSKADAKRYATFLRYIAGDAQKAGFDVGELPPGYLPITKANGLGALVAATKKAADQIQDQNAGLPVTSTSSATPTAETTTTPITGGVVPVAPAAPTTIDPNAAAPTVTNGPLALISALGATLGLGSGVAALVLPLVLLLALVAGLVALVVYGAARYRVSRAWGGTA